jgi:serine/threonine protein kinase
LTNEANVANALRRAYQRTGQKKALYSDIQGTSLAVLGKMVNRDLVQQKIQGLDAWNAIQSKDPAESPYANGSVGNPQEQALQYILELVLAVHAMHNHRDENGNLTPIVHNDIKTPNMMLEKQENSQFRLRLIDLGASTDEGADSRVFSYNTAPERLLQDPPLVDLWEAKTSQDIYSIGVELPALLFGRGANALVSLALPRGKLIGQPKHDIRRICPSEFANKYLQMAIEKLKSNASFKTQYEAWAKKINSLTNNLDTKMKKLAVPGKTEDDLAKQIALLEIEPKVLTKELYALLEQDKEGQKAVQKLMRAEIHGDFKKINPVMKQKTKKCYPDDILQRMAYMTSDCMSPYAGARPTTEHIILALQNMRFADWTTADAQGQHRLQGAGPTTPEEIAIQNAFPWITRAE